MRTPKGDFLTFDDSVWLPRIYNDDSKEIVIQKSSQARISTYAIFWTLHFAIFNKCTTIFTQPTRDDAQKFSASRVGPIVEQNPYFFDYILGGTELRRASQKPGGPVNSFIHYRGTYGAKEAFTIDADAVVIDEVDQSNPDVIPIFDTRLIASKWGYKRYISTPSIPNYGINVYWRLSDQQTWLVRCVGCNHDIDLLADFWDIFKEDELKYLCPKCGKEINRRHGRWVPKRTRGVLMRGYQVTQAMMTYVPPFVIALAMNTQKPRDFANYYLGIPSDDGVGQVSREMIEAKCFLSRHERSKDAVGKRRAMGVDQGDRIYCEISEIDQETGRSKIVDLVVTTNWDEIGRLMTMHEIEVCVIDARPEVRLARRLAHDFPGRVFPCEYVSIHEPVRWLGSEQYFIGANRTQVLDAAAEDIASGMTQLYWPRDENTDHDRRPFGWIQHWENQRRLEPDEPDGVPRWQEVGPDHWSHADVYRKIAESRIRNRPINTVWMATGGHRVFTSSGVIASSMDQEEAERVMGEPERGLGQAPRTAEQVLAPRRRQVLYRNRR